MKSPDKNYSVIHEAPIDQLLRWWDKIEPLPAPFLETGLDEVAYALSRQSAGVEKLKRFLYSPDPERRWGALYFLAYPDTDDNEVRQALFDAFLSEDPHLASGALWGLVHLGFFPLDRNAVSRLLNAGDHRLAASAMVYLSHAFPAEAISILRRGLHSDNPRMREYACDEIGDRELYDLKEEMRLLLADSDENVAQAARANLEILQEDDDDCTQ